MCALVTYTRKQDSIIELSVFSQSVHIVGGNAISVRLALVIGCLQRIL